MQPGFTVLHRRTSAVRTRDTNRGDERSYSSGRLRQGAVALAFVASVGFCAPNMLGGAVSADALKNPNAFETTLNCTVGDTVVSYDTVTTGAAASFQDTDSATVFVVVHATYEGSYVAVDPPDPEDTFDISGAHGPGYPNGHKKGQLANALVCHSVGTEIWTSDGSDGIEGHTYYGVIDNTWYVTVRNTLKSASADKQLNSGAGEKERNKQAGNHPRNGTKHKAKHRR